MYIQDFNFIKSKIRLLRDGGSYQQIEKMLDSQSSGSDVNLKVPTSPGGGKGGKNKKKK